MQRILYSYLFLAQLVTVKSYLRPGRQFPSRSRFIALAHRDASEFWGSPQLSFLDIEDHVRKRLDGIDGTTDECVNVLSCNPPLVMIHNFLSTSMCQELIETARESDKLARSTTGNSQEVSQSRTSSTLWLSDSECSGPSRLIAEKVSSISGLPPNHMENLQICRYQPGQEFRLHTDHQDDFNELDCGGRLGTCLIYLKEPERGGATYFPELGDLRIETKTGSALWFWNTMERPGSAGYQKDMFLNADTRMKHAGLPVEEGEKWICNRWVHPVLFPAGVQGLRSRIEVA